MSASPFAPRPASGQSTAELAILLPVVVLLVLAVVQVGLVARDQVGVHHAAREAARRAAIDPRPGPVLEGARAAAPGLDGDRLAVSLHGGRSPGDLTTVRVRYRSTTGVPMVGALVGDIELTAVAVVRVE